MKRKRSKSDRFTGQRQNESLDLFIYRLSTEPEKVRAEMEAEIIQEYGPDYFTPEQLDAHWEAALGLI